MDEKEIIEQLIKLHEDDKAQMLRTKTLLEFIKAMEIRISKLEENLKRLAIND